MRVHARYLVLYKVVWVVELADVVVVSPDPGEQGVRPDPLGGVLGQVAHLHGVGERTGCPAQELLEEGFAGVRKLQELLGREDVEGALQQRQEDHRQHQREETVTKTDPAKLHGYLEVAAPDQGDREGHDG